MAATAGRGPGEETTHAREGRARLLALAGSEPGHTAALADRAAGIIAVDPAVELDPRWFTRTERAEFTITRSATVDELVAQLASRSYLLALAPGRREMILRDARIGLSAATRRARLDVRCRTTVLRARRRGDAS
jgi:hypothetical protein